MNKESCGVLLTRSRKYLMLVLELVSLPLRCDLTELTIIGIWAM